MGGGKQCRQNVLNDLKPKMTLVSIEPLPALEQIVRQQNGLPLDGGNSGVRVGRGFTVGLQTAGVVAVQCQPESQVHCQGARLWLASRLLPLR
jgi:ribosomal protein L13E